MEVPLKLNKFSVKLSAFFKIKKINQYKVFEKVAAYRRFWELVTSTDEISMRGCQLDSGTA